MNPTTLVLVTDGFEEIELVTPVDLLRRAGSIVTLAGIGPGNIKTGRCDMRLAVDCSLEDIDPAGFDLLFLPGGPGVAALRKDGRPARLAAAQAAAGRLVGAICAAPTILFDAGLLQPGTAFTAHFSVADQLPGMRAGEKVLRDGPLITSRGAGTAMDFGLALVASLFGREKRDEIASAIML